MSNPDVFSNVSVGDKVGLYRSSVKNGKGELMLIGITNITKVLAYHIILQGYDEVFKRFNGLSDRGFLVAVPYSAKVEKEYLRLNQLKDKAKENLVLYQRWKAVMDKVNNGFKDLNYDTSPSRRDKLEAIIETMENMLK